MKNFKDFMKDYEDGNFTYNDKTFAYAAYCQGYAEAKSEIAVFDDGKGNYFPLVPNVPAPHFPYDQFTYDTQAQLLHAKAEKMKVYPGQLKKEYYPEELEETKKAIARTRNLSEEERNAEFARQVEELKQNPNSVLNAIAMQKAAEKVEEK